MTHHNSECPECGDNYCTVFGFADPEPDPEPERVFPTDTDAIAYLSQDDGYVPCSRYGRSGSECAPIAAASARIIARECGEDVTVELLEHAMGLAVNDHDDPALTVVMHGLEHGYDAESLLGIDVLERTVLEDIPHYYDSDTRDIYVELYGIGVPTEDDESEE